MKSNPKSSDEISNLGANIPELLTDTQRLGHISQNSNSLKVQSRFGVGEGGIQMFAVQHSAEFNSTTETTTELTGDNNSSDCCIIL